MLGVNMPLARTEKGIKDCNCWNNSLPIIMGRGTPSLQWFKRSLRGFSTPNTHPDNAIYVLKQSINKCEGSRNLGQSKSETK